MNSTTFARALRGERQIHPVASKAFAMLMRDDFPTTTRAGLKAFVEAVTGAKNYDRGEVKAFKECLTGSRPIASFGGNRQTRELRESQNQDDGLSVGDGDAILRDVFVLGAESQNRRRYTPQAIADAIGMYEGVKVNIDHPDGNPNAVRRVKDRFGRLENVRMVGGELRGDLAYNPRHHMAETVEWWAKNDPSAIGLSHNAVGAGKTDASGIFVIDKILSVRSVDIVADPATTAGIR